MKLWYPMCWSLNHSDKYLWSQHYDVFNDIIAKTEDSITCNGWRKNGFLYFVCVFIIIHLSYYLLLTTSLWHKKDWTYGIMYDNIIHDIMCDILQLSNTFDDLRQNIILVWYCTFLCHLYDDSLVFHDEIIRIIQSIVLYTILSSTNLKLHALLYEIQWIWSSNVLDS